MAFDINRLLTVLNNTGLQTKDNSLYQLLKQLIEGIGSLNGQVDSINGAINVINEAIANTISTVVQLHLGTDSGDSNSGTDNIPASSTPFAGSPVTEMTPLLASVLSDSGTDGLDGRDGIDGVAGIDGKSPISLIPQDGIDGLDSLQLVPSSGQPIPQSQSISNLMQYLSGIGVDSSEAEPNIIPFYLNAADIAMLGRTNEFRTVSNLVFFRIISNGEAQFTIWADKGGVSSDTDAFIRFVIDAGGTLKGLMGYDQGLDRFVIGMNGTGYVKFDTLGNMEFVPEAGISKYSGIATTGWGVPAIYAYERLTGQTTAVTNLAAYTVGAADGTFEVNVIVTVTVAVSAAATIQVNWTDENSFVSTSNFPLKAEGSNTVTTSFSTVRSYSGQSIIIRAKAATVINVSTSGTFVSGNYNVEANIKQVA